MPWEKGQSGNPAGRKVQDTAELRALARQYTPQALAALVEALDDPKLKVAAANAILDRGWGRPVQEITGADGGPLVAGIAVHFVAPPTGAAEPLPYPPPSAPDWG